MSRGMPTKANGSKTVDMVAFTPHVDPASFASESTPNNVKNGSQSPGVTRRSAERFLARAKLEHQERPTPQSMNTLRDAEFAVSRLRRAEGAEPLSTEEVAIDQEKPKKSPVVDVMSSKSREKVAKKASALKQKRVRNLKLQEVFDLMDAEKEPFSVTQWHISYATPEPYYYCITGGTSRA